ncbi:carbon-nitrogen hydrolase family protein [Enemella sp. A6]|uniref:carbon-nitrogen hydrolase family protein n=1 Tax=Enemella sp. A6 TaxID=3440152 RepID=UPI003EBA5E16
MRIAVAQITSSRDLDDNLNLVGRQVAAAAASGAELVVFPEAAMRAFGHRLTDIAEPLDGPWATGVREYARRHGVVVAAGMFTPGTPNDRGEPRVINTLLVTGRDRDGREIEEHYDKLNLFDAFGFRESDTVQPGDREVIVDIGGVKVGLTICFDVRFPELFRNLARAGAQAIICCASWHSGPGKVEQWDLLVRARALDSTSWLIAAGQADPAISGIESKRGAPTGVGHSAVISPRGEVVGRLGAGPGLLLHDLDLSGLDEVRQEIPVLG